MVRLALDCIAMEPQGTTSQTPTRFPFWVLGLTVTISAVLTIYGGIRAFYYQSSFLAPIAYTTDERPTAERLAGLLGTSPGELLVGIHAFFDFLVSYYWGTLGNPWLQGAEVLPVNYPPGAMAFMEVWALFPYKTALAIYLPLMAVALITPAVVSLWGVRWSLVVLAAGITLLSGPAIASLDRGNTQGFVPLLLFAFGVFALKGRWGWASIFLVLAASLKIFPALLLVVLIAERKWRALAGSIIALAVIHTAPFLLYPGDPRVSFQTWFSYAFTFLGRDDLAGFLEYNASFVGGLAHWAMFLGLSALAGWIESVSTLLAVGVTAVVIGVIFLRTRLSLSIRLFAAFMTSTTILPVAYPYTANWIIAAVAVLFLGAIPQLRSGLETAMSVGDRMQWNPPTVMWSALAVSSALMMAFAPVFIPGSMESGYRAGVASLFMPIAVTISLVGMYWAAWRTDRMPRPATSIPDPSIVAVER